MRNKQALFLFFAAKHRLFSVAVVVLLFAAGDGGVGVGWGGGQGYQARKVFLFRSWPAAVNATLLAPPPLIKHEWWAVWVKGRSREGVHRGSLWSTAVHSPGVAIGRAIKPLAPRWTA